MTTSPKEDMVVKRLNQLLCFLIVCAVLVVGLLIAGVVVAAVVIKPQATESLRWFGDVHTQMGDMHDTMMKSTSELGKLNMQDLVTSVNKVVTDVGTILNNNPTLVTTTTTAFNTLVSHVDAFVQRFNPGEFDALKSNIIGLVEAVNNKLAAVNAESVNQGVSSFNNVAQRADVLMAQADRLGLLAQLMHTLNTTTGVGQRVLETNQFIIELKK
jgi:hypothetical protein